MFPPLEWGRHRQQQETQDIHSALKTDQILQDNHMFTCIYSTQKKGWRPVRKTIATHTNSFSKQQEHKGMISLSDRIIITSLLHQLNAIDLTGGIIKKEDQIKTSNSIPLIEDLEISNIFKDKDDKEGNSVINELITKIS